MSKFYLTDYKSSTSLGWAYDLKTVSVEMIKRRLLRTGDGSHRYSKLNSKEAKVCNSQKSIDVNGNYVHLEEESIWGYNDELMSEEDKKCIKILNQYTQ